MNKEKKTLSQQEEAILKFWRERRIFEKSLAKNTPKGPFDKAQGKEFIFYEGPPTANGKPGIHHLEARAFKDAITRYKTMRGFYVRRKGGWDTHGLPVELGVEKELGLKSKKEIETYGIGAFNKKCRESVWRYIKEWEEFTDRIGYWIDLKRPYVTYKPHYIEAVWNIISKINERGLLYKDYKVVPWCPRCGTALSSHELAQGYETIKDTALTVKFQITNPPPAPSLRRAGKSQTNHNPPAGGQIPNGGQTYLLAWTTTPWTLPGNVALAVNQKIKYVLVLSDHVRYIVAKELVAEVFREKPYEISAELSAEELIGLEYEAPFPFLKDVLSGSVRDNPHANPRESASLENAFKVYAADFVTTEEGTGIVHTAVMYGQDDFELGTKVGLPKYHLVKEDGTFKEETITLSKRTGLLKKKPVFLRASL
ncbi:MAG: class I tRNA ligase family protein [Candidatus Taylorbacteria bacterium]|nr:class I tRNA ligase family protein [Candidatus Taylorbacteria bacterium]